MTRVSMSNLKWIPWMGFVVNELFLYKIYQYLFWKVALENVYFSNYTEQKIRNTKFQCYKDLSGFVVSKIFIQKTWT